MNMYNKPLLKRLKKEGERTYINGEPFIDIGGGERMSLELLNAWIDFDPSNPNPQKAERWTLSDGEYRKHGRF